MKRYFSGMIAQHAPTPRTARQALESFAGTSQTALAMPHCTKLKMAFASTASKMTETMPFGIDENKLVRSQRSTGLPICGRRAARGASGISAIAVMSALHQRDARIVPVHEEADAEADGEKHRHDQSNCLDRLAGLVQRRVGDRDHVLIADRHRERGVLGQVEVLARHWRHDDA